MRKSGPYSVRQRVIRHGSWRWVRLIACQTEAEAFEELRKRKDDPDYPYVPGKLAVFQGEQCLIVRK